MAVCRAAAIPSRFVSGCQEGDPDCQEADLHGWAEVYLPGFGWRGYDPTHGLAVADRHIVYAASALVANAAPVSGSFRGTGATAQMQHRIRMQRIQG
jgi:transglutaminase-like putative cysteine protease